MTNRRALPVAALCSIAIMTVACGASTDRVNERDVAGWLEAYGAAWETKNSADVAQLFTDDALYQETPYAAPFRGREAIVNYWDSVTADQNDIEFDFNTLAITGATGIAEWSARFRSISNDVPVELNGVFVLEFADASHVRSLREWWHAR
jgi:ketosteroid isomerase-like protein